VKRARGHSPPSAPMLASCSRRNSLFEIRSSHASKAATKSRLGLDRGADAAPAYLDSPSGQATALAHITSALLSDSSAHAIDTALRNTVEFARNSIGIERVAIYLVAPGGLSMVGAWGTDMAGRTTDEHELMYDMNDLLRKFFARSASGHLWSVYQDCPLVTDEGGKSRTVGRGWNPAYGGGEGGRRRRSVIYRRLSHRAAGVVGARASRKCRLFGLGAGE
jgi:hypothetical protein